MVYFIVWLIGTILSAVVFGVILSFETRTYYKEVYENKSLIIAIACVFWFIVLPLLIISTIQQETTKNFKYLENNRAKRKAVR